MLFSCVAFQLNAGEDDIRTLLGIVFQNLSEGANITETGINHHNCLSDAMPQIRQFLHWLYRSAAFKLLFLTVDVVALHCACLSASCFSWLFTSTCKIYCPFGSGVPRNTPQRDTYFL